MIKQNQEVDWSNYANNCGTHAFFPTNQTLIWLMNGSPSCEVEVKILNTVKVALILDVDVFDFYKDIGESKFVDRVASVLNIHPSRIKIVGVTQGSTILDFVILEDTA